MYMRVSVRQSDLCVSAIVIADCVLSCMFLGFSVLFMVSSPEPAPPAAPCALHRCGFPVGTLMRLDAKYGTFYIQIQHQMAAEILETGFATTRSVTPAMRDAAC